MFSSYFSGRFILSKGALLNSAFSPRSDGKTFDCKARALEDYENGKHITIYLRRYKTELTPKLYNSFFDEVLAIKEYKRFNKWQFKGSKTGIQVKTSDKEGWDYIVFFVALSMSGKLKSQISEVHRIEIIDYDEFIPLDNRYLKDEIQLLLEFWKSIDRDREKVQLLILGNKVTPFNPFFDYFNINIKIDKEKIKTYRNGTIAIQVYENKEHEDKRKKGKFREMIKGTSYEEYDSGGILNALELKLRTKEGLDYIYSFKTAKGEGSVWYNNGNMVISEYKRQDGFLLVDKVYKTSRQQYVCKYGSFPTVLKSIYNRGNMYFESEKAFYMFEDILIKIGTV